MEKDGHFTQEGLEKIILLREKLNEGKGRKRKHTLTDYQASISENPQRLNAESASGGMI